MRSLPKNILRLLSPSDGVFQTGFAVFRRAMETGASWSGFRDLLDAVAAPKWARYPLGCLITFAQAQSWFPETGLEFEIDSNVPQSFGVSSSAALEIATLRALETFSGRGLVGTQIAHLGQDAENHFVGAPCGLMDQLASAFGKPRHLLPILCRPDRLLPLIPLPPGVRVVGWPSGVKHAVTGSPYSIARAATFMGKRIAERRSGNSWSCAAEIPLSRFRSGIESLLPEQMRGTEFTREYGSTDDPLTTVDASITYPVRAALRFAVEENARCEQAIHLFSDAPGRPDNLAMIGELLYRSHAGYSSIGLGCPETDGIVRALQSAGTAAGIFGARVSGGGSGGTVIVLIEDDAVTTLHRLQHSKDLPALLLID
ncbi:MAG: hypothetical protein P4L99_25870 [Chthoniobacter sp.]|nr:hypothetical protein [Chthoniobacter sp.]